MLRTLLPLLLLGGCTGELAYPAPDPAPQASASLQDVTLTADTQVEAPAGRRLTPVLVTVRNSGEAPVRVPPSAFDLVPHTGGRPMNAVSAPGQSRGEALRNVVLDPGEAATGYVFFDGTVPPGTAMDLLAQVETDDGTALGTAVLPLEAR
jgi:hypothetical protein